MWLLRVESELGAVTAEVSPEIDLLSQMQAAVSFQLRRSCKNGVCTICRCRLVEGEITYGHRKAHGLWEAEVAEGYILPCIAFVRSDVVLDSLAIVLGAD